MVPTLQTTALGVKGHRPVVGTDDNKALVYTFAAVNILSGQLTTRLIDSPARATAKTGKSKTRRLQEAFAKHLRDIARAYPAGQHAFVVLTIDNAPWTPEVSKGGGLSTKSWMSSLTSSSIGCRATAPASTSLSGCGSACADALPTIASSPPWLSRVGRCGQACVISRP
jgi:hypothetical protein